MIHEICIDLVLLIQPAHCAMYTHNRTLTLHCGSMPKKAKLNSRISFLQELELSHSPSAFVSRRAMKAIIYMLRSHTEGGVCLTFPVLHSSIQFRTLGPALLEGFRIGVRCISTLKCLWTSLAVCLDG